MLINLQFSRQMTKHARQMLWSFNCSDMQPTGPTHVTRRKQARAQQIRVLQLEVACYNIPSLSKLGCQMPSTCIHDNILCMGVWTWDTKVKYLRCYSSKVRISGSISCQDRVQEIGRLDSWTPDHLFTLYEQKRTQHNLQK